MNVQEQIERISKQVESNLKKFAANPVSLDSLKESIGLTLQQLLDKEFDSLKISDHIDLLVTVEEQDKTMVTVRMLPLTEYGKQIIEMINNQSRYLYIKSSIDLRA